MDRKQYWQEYRKKHIEKHRAFMHGRNLRKRFGLTPEEYQTMLEAQNYVCDICKQPPTAKRRLAVDHCHKTDEVRGLLCFSCNTSLGQFEANAEAFLDYLTK